MLIIIAGMEIVSLKNRFSFRLGTTSYIIPADLRTNVEFLADKVDDVELVLFESDEISNLPDQSTIRNLRDLANKHDLTYTVHLPLDAWTGHGEDLIRERSVDKCLRVIERTAPLLPFAYVLHLHGDQRGECPSPDIERWIEGQQKSLRSILQSVSPREICVETLDYPFEIIEEIITAFDLSVCLDIGHLLLCNYAPEDYLDRYMSIARIIHLHGIEKGIDHQSIAFLPSEILSTIIERLNNRSNIPRVLTIEIFDKMSLDQSLNIFSRFI